MSSPDRSSGYRHEALLYAGADDFANRATPIITRALEAEEPVLVAIDRGKIQLLRERLGQAADAVGWKDIRGIGGNPARIIPVWHQFVAAHAGRGRLWGFGEPIWAGRSAAGLIEAQHHERLLNLAFTEADGFNLICPYDTLALDGSVLQEAHHSHPLVSGNGEAESPAYPGSAAFAEPFHAALPEPSHPAPTLDLDGVTLLGIRAFLLDHTKAARQAAARIADLAVAVAAVVHSMGRPGARLRVWEDDDGSLAQISDLTPLHDPLAGREWPPPTGPTHGLWLANQLCDLVQHRSFPSHAVVRLHMAGPSAH
jgi:hypothetical protein